jgi:hypothetical protein
VFKPSGTQLSVGGRWWSGQEHRGRLGIDGLLLVVVIGDGKLGVPVAFEVRRPAPVGPGGPCRDQLPWLQVMLARPCAALRRRCRPLPPPLGVAERWFGDSKVIGPVATHLQGTWLVEGKSPYAFQLPDGRRVKGQAFRTRDDWPWHDRAPRPRVREARLTASRPPAGMVPVVIIDAPGEARFYLRCRATALTAPRLIRAWRRRRAMEHFFRILKHLLATEACQVHTEAASDGHLVLRLLAGLVLLYTSRILYKSRVTMEALVFSLKHHWRFLTSEPLQ